jgi:hypothetical protein
VAPAIDLTAVFFARFVSRSCRRAKSGAQPFGRPLGLQAGWSVAKACTTPHLEQVNDSAIEFGELVGSGSFGRVYQAK